MSSKKRSKAFSTISPVTLFLSVRNRNATNPLRNYFKARKKKHYVLYLGTSSSVKHPANFYRNENSIIIFLCENIISENSKRKVSWKRIEFILRIEWKSEESWKSVTVFLKMGLKKRKNESLKFGCHFSQAILFLTLRKIFLYPSECVNAVLRTRHVRKSAFSHLVI